MKKTSLVFTLIIVGAASARGQTNVAFSSRYESLGKVGWDITEHLSAFDSTSNHMALAAAVGKLNRVTTTNKLMFNSALLASLDILQRCALAIDSSFNPDTSRRPTTKVAPPFGPGRIAGMDPSNIQDPEDRAIYIAAIAENDALKAKFTKEKYLRNLYDQTFLRTKVMLESVVNAADSQALGQATHEIKGRIKDQATQAKLLEAVTNAVRKAEAWRAK